VLFAFVVFGLVSSVLAQLAGKKNKVGGTFGRVGGLTLLRSFFRFYVVKIQNVSFPTFTMTLEDHRGFAISAP